MSSLPESLVGKTVAVLGGTGPQGRGLARRFAAAGIPVVLGSRSAERASDAAVELATAVGGDVTGADNAGAAAAGDIVVVAVPWDGHGELLTSLKAELAGKVVIDCVNPLGLASKARTRRRWKRDPRPSQAQGPLGAPTRVAPFTTASAC